MKRLALSLSITLFTFLIGVLLTQGLNRVFALVPLGSEVDAVPQLTYLTYLTCSREITTAPLTNDLVVNFIGYKTTEFGTYGEFAVTNGSSENAYYSGYNQQSHCAEFVRQFSKIEKASDCWCGTGLSEQALAPGETVIFDMKVPTGDEFFEAGFDFHFGDERRTRTFWSQSIKYPSGVLF